MPERNPSEISAIRFCGSCGAAVTPGESDCAQCGSPVRHEDDSQVLTGDYIPYCRACGVPVAKEAALNCTKCGVTPLCRDHFYPSTRSCALCPPIDLTQPGVSTQPGELATGTAPNRPNGPWAQPPASVLCPRCQARIRLGVEFCPNCGAEQEEAGEDSKYAGFLVRLSAFIIDSLAPIILSVIIFSIVEVPGLFLILLAGYHLFFTYKLGQTPGKMLLGIQVVGKDGDKPGLQQVIMREVVGKAISFLLFFIGFIWVIWAPQKRGWHDYISGTFVVKKKRD